MTTPSKLVPSVFSLLPLLLLTCPAACASSDGTEDDNTMQSEAALATGGVSFAVNTIEPGNLITSGIAIAVSEAKAKPVVVYSIPLTGITHSEALHIAGQVSVSRCNKTDIPSGHGQGMGDNGSPCESHKSYSYAPHIKARLVLHDTTGGSNVVKVLDTVDYQCSLELHHCPLPVSANVGGLAVSKGSIDIDVLAYADPKETPTNDVVELEGECLGDDYKPCHPIPASLGDQQKPDFNTSGQLTLTRVGNTATEAKTTVTNLVNNKIPITTASDHPGGPTLLFSKALKNLHPGDVIEANAVIWGKNDPKNAPYKFDHFVGTWIFLTSSPTDTRPTGPGARWISSFAGKNCDTSQPGGDCKRDIRGAVVAPTDLPAGGVTMYINVAGWAIEKGPNSVGVTGKLLDILPSPTPTLSFSCISALRADGSAPCGS